MYNKEIHQKKDEAQTREKRLHPKKNTWTRKETVKMYNQICMDKNIKAEGHKTKSARISKMKHIQKE